MWHMNAQVALTIEPPSQFPRPQETWSSTQHVAVTEVSSSPSRPMVERAGMVPSGTEATPQAEHSSGRLGTLLKGQPLLLVWVE